MIPPVLDSEIHPFHGTPASRMRQGERAWVTFSRHLEGKSLSWEIEREIQSLEGR
jgi:hypothetical protein